jgi:non-specific serine/threonine protein kinase
LQLCNLGFVRQHRSEYEQALALQGEALALMGKLGDRRGAALCLQGLAGVLAATGAPRPAAVLLGAAEGLREAVQAGVDLTDQAHYDHARSSARAALGEEAFAEARVEGRAMSLEQAIVYALEE